MSGFDNGTLQGGAFAQAKQFGPILRGYGPPVPTAGAQGDVYIDVQTWFLYVKREASSTDPWGAYLFVVPDAYRNTLNWFSAYLLGNDVGTDGDYCLLWGGYNNYGMQLSVFGPKDDGCWPESGSGPDTLYDPAYAGYELPAGLSDEGSITAFSVSTQLIVAGLADEYILATPVAAVSNTPVSELGLLSYPANVAVNMNPIYTSEDVHPI